MLKKVILSAIVMGSVMLCTQNAFALGAASVNGSLHPDAVECGIGDVFYYDMNNESANKKSDKALLLAVSVDLTNLGSTRFNINLDGAVWNDTMTKGTFKVAANYEENITYDDYAGDYSDSEGVSYRRLNDSSLAVTIERKKVDKKFKFYVPLNCTIVSDGNITVSLDGVAYTPTTDKVVFASADIVDSLVTEETTTESTSETTTRPGSKILSSVKETTTKSSKTVKDETTTIKETTTKATTEVTTEATTEATEATTETTTEVATETTTKATTAIQYAPALRNRVVSFVSGGDNYYINNTVVPTDVRPYVSSTGYTMLPFRAFANALDIENISFDADTKTAELTLYDGSILSITAYENSYTVNGTSVAIDGCAEIKDGRLFLPLRAMANAFGISNDYIEYDADTKTATVFIR